MMLTARPPQRVQAKRRRSAIRLERRSIFNAGRREGDERRLKARGARARRAEGACAHGFQAGNWRRQHAAALGKTFLPGIAGRRRKKKVVV
jgi:hypothetical protein